jgi:2-succinyl-6-hydroxy-2,4-cyclohexadiene-1-carboxylate synthase
VGPVRDEQPQGALHSIAEGHGARVVLVHGFTQNSNCWGPLADDLVRDHEVVRVDAPGHGGSSTVHAGLHDGGRLIAASGGHATYIGYSMGARFALHLALDQPQLARGLVLIGGTAGIDDDDERAERKRADDANAARLESDGLEPFLDRWLAQPLFAGLPKAMQFRDERSTNTMEGLASSLRLAGTGSQAALWSELHRLDMPVLAIAGADDTKFCAAAERMVAAIGANATTAFIPDAGHTAHLEQPRRSVDTVRAWLDVHGL